MANYSLLFSMGADTSAMQKGIAKAEKRVAGLKNKMGGLKSAIASVGLVAIGRNALQTASEIQNLAMIAGVTAEELQKVGYAASQFGISQEKVADILKDVNDKVGDFLQTGAGPMADFFENIAPKVGVTAEQFRKLSSKDALQLYVDSLEKANVSQAEMTFYLEAIASDATALLPILQNNGAEVKRLGEEYANTGQLMDDEMIKSLNEANLTIKEATNKVTVFAGRILEMLMPALSMLGQGLGVVQKVVQTALENFFAFANFLGTLVTSVIAPLQKAFEALAYAVEGVNAAMDKDFDTAKDMLAEAKKAFNGIADEAQAIPGKIEQAFKDMKDIATTNVKEAFDEIADQGGKFESNWKKIVDSTKKTVNSIKQAVAGASEGSANAQVNKELNDFFGDMNTDTPADTAAKPKSIFGAGSRMGKNLLSFGDDDESQSERFDRLAGEFNAKFTTGDKTKSKGEKYLKEIAENTKGKSVNE